MLSSEKLEYIVRCSRLEGCEVGDSWERLVSLYEYEIDYYSQEFKQAVEKGLELIYQDLKTNWKIVEEEVEQTYTETVESLEYIG